MVGFKPESEVKLSQTDHATAGAISSALSRAIGQPLDVLKIRFQLQVEPITKESKVSKYHSLTQAVRTIITEESYRALWKGHVPAQALSVTYGIVQYTVFEYLTRQAWTKLPSSSSQRFEPLTHTICGSMSACVATVVVQPIDILRTRLIAQGEPKVYRSILHACISVAKNEGVRGFYKGLIPTLGGVAPQMGLQFGLYSSLQIVWNRVLSLPAQHHPGPIESLVCGSGAGLLAKFIIYPMDVVKKRLQVQGFEEARIKFGATRKYNGLIHCVKSLLREEGLIGLYKVVFNEILQKGGQILKVLQNVFKSRSTVQDSDMLLAHLNMLQPNHNSDFGLLETPNTSDSSGAEQSGYVSTGKETSCLTIPSSTELSDRTKRQNSYSRSGSSSRQFSRSFSNPRSAFTPQLGARSSGIPRSGSCQTPRLGSASGVRSGGSRVTPQTTSSGTPGPTPRVSDSSAIIAIVEGRGLAKGEIGMASLDLKKPELVLSQFSDMPTYIKALTKLQIVNPVEIVLPSTAYESGSMTSLSKLISENFSNTSISTVQRKYFNETKGLLYVKQLCVPEYSSVELEIATKYYCLAAAAALIKYIEFIQNTVYASASLKITFKGSENTAMIDALTVKNLELLQNLRDPRSDHTLYGILNYTKTAGGARLLRSNILQPPSDIETITTRHEVVAELIEKEEIFYNLQAVIGRFLDIDHLLSTCVQVPKQENVKTAENKIANVIYLKHTLELVEPLKEAVGNCENPLMKALYKLLDDKRFSQILEKINFIIHEGCRYQKGVLNMRSQKCFAVKENVNGLLDIARKTYTEIVDDIDNMISQMSKTYSLPLKPSYNTSRGFHIQMYAGGNEVQYTTDNLPGVFVKVTKFKNTFSFTTADLIKMNDRVNGSLQEIYMMASMAVRELLDSVREDIGCLYKLSESVAMLDMLVAFAHACTLSDYVKPEFTDTLAVKQGRHPLLEKISVEPPVPNNIYASSDSNFMVITGPNMSGKSTYLRQIALLQIMAQIGSFVPAEYAAFRVTSQIFSRLGNDDDLETNSSTFVLEMKEMNYILQTATSNSLIIIDELGRGTSAEEGVGLCFAICEFLSRLKAFTFFVTHFLELTSLDSLYPNIENYFFEVQRDTTSIGNHEKVIYTHVLSKGKTEEKHYGIQLAELSTMPREIVTEARHLAGRIADEKQKNQSSDKDLCRQRAVFKLATQLSQAARNSRLDDESLKQYVINLKQNYEEEMKNIEE